MISVGQQFTSTTSPGFTYNISNISDLQNGQDDGQQIVTIKSNAGDLTAKAGSQFTKSDVESKFASGEYILVTPNQYTLKQAIIAAAGAVNGAQDKESIDSALSNLNAASNNLSSYINS